jgi:hypothetical protein
MLAVAASSQPQGMEAVAGLMVAAKLHTYGYVEALEEEGYDDLDFLCSMDDRGLRAVATQVCP